MNHISIKWKLSIAIAVIVFIMSTILVSLSIYNIKKASQKDIELFSEKAFGAKKDELKSNVEIALKTIEYFYRKTPEASREVMQIRNEKDMIFVDSIITHTLFCINCKRFKQVV